MLAIIQVKSIICMATQSILTIIIIKVRAAVDACIQDMN